MNYLTVIVLFFSTPLLASGREVALEIETFTSSHSNIQAEVRAVRTLVAKAFTDGLVERITRNSQGAKIHEMVCVEFVEFTTKTPEYSTFLKAVNELVKADRSNVSATQRKTCP